MNNNLIKIFNSLKMIISNMKTFQFTNKILTNKVKNKYVFLKKTKLKIV